MSDTTDAASEMAGGTAAPVTGDLTGIPVEAEKLSRPLEAGYFETFPQEIWIKVLDYLVVNTQRTRDSFPKFEHSGEEARINRQTLRSLSITCKSLTDLSQARLFRVALPPVGRKSFFGDYGKVGQKLLFGTLLHGRAFLQAAVRSTAFDLALDVDYSVLAACMPNLAHLEIYASGDPPSYPRYTQLPKLLSGMKQLTHIKIGLAMNGGTLEDLPFTVIPTNFSGHLSIHSLNLYHKEEEAPEICVYPNLASLTLCVPEIAGDGLAYLLGTAKGQIIPTFAIVNSSLEYEWNLDALVDALGENLQELTFIGSICYGFLPIEGFPRLRKLVLAGNLLQEDVEEEEELGAGVEQDLDGQLASASIHDTARRLPKVLESLHIVDPLPDIFRTTEHMLLPQLEQLKRLDIELPTSAGSYSRLYSDLLPKKPSNGPDHAGWLKILQEAGHLDDACKARRIMTTPTSFRQGLEIGMAAEEEDAKQRALKKANEKPEPLKYNSDGTPQLQVPDCLTT